MEIRIFQIVVPLIALLFIGQQLLGFRKNQSSWFETLLISFFWIGVTALALFPDLISDAIAQSLGIKSNINALVFFALGLLFYFQLQLYKIIKKQDLQLTEMARKIALNNIENESTEA